MADFDQALADQWTQRLQADPTYQQLVAAVSKRVTNQAEARSYYQAQAALTQYLEQSGFPKDQRMVVDPSTGRVIQQKSTWEQTPGWFKGATIGTLGLAAAPFALGAAGVGAGAGAGAGATTAGATGATVAGVGGAAAASSPSWLGPILGAGIGAGAQLGGAAIAAHGNTEAAKIQDAFAREALAYEKERDKYGSATEANRYAAMMSGLSPYVDTGADADVRMAQLLGLPAPRPRATTAPPPQYATPNLPGTPPTAAPANPAGQTAQAVQMRAPDGSTQSVPPDQIAHYEQRGAVRV